MASAIRDSPFGQLARFLTRNKAYQYADEKPGFSLPEAWQRLANDAEGPRLCDQSESTASSSSASSIAAVEDEIQPETRIDSEAPSDSHVKLEKVATHNQVNGDAEKALKLEKTQSIPIVPRVTKDGAILVDWYYSDDLENPQNWSYLRKALITFVICLYTFVVYMSSAIYTTSEQGVIEEFGVSGLKASLGLSLFVLG
jgi:DHA1 family multidrug resistance protein-like MFS transporter